MALLLVVVFLSPTDPVFILVVPLGIFFLTLGSVPGIRMTGAVLTVLALLALAPWRDGLFLVIYLVSSCAIASLLLRLRGGLEECLSYLASSLAGCFIAALYLTASGWAEYLQFEEKLGSELLRAAREGFSRGLYSLMDVNAADSTRWLESGVKFFVHLTPAFIVLVTIASCYLAVTLLRFASRGEQEYLPEPGYFAEFRFDDNLVWLFTGGLALLIAPLPAAVRRVGANAAFIMGAMFLLRGVSVWISYLGRRMSSPVSKGILTLVLFVLFPPVAAGLALVVGLVDIWIDVRNIPMRKGAA